MATFSALPNELVSLVLTHACANGDGPALSTVSPRLHTLTDRALYRHLELSSSHALKLLVRSLSARPALAQHVRSLALYTGRVPFEVAQVLARILAPYQDRLMHLCVRFPASDLPLALDFLEALNPTHFEWITSPTWMIRPGKLFQRFLTKWTRLRSLRLGNFFLDAVLAESIASLPQITHLTLLGQSNKNLEPDSIRTLLEGIPKLVLLEVGDCPLRRRVIVEAELGTGTGAMSNKSEPTSLGESLPPFANSSPMYRPSDGPLADAPYDRLPYSASPPSSPASDSTPSLSSSPSASSASSSISSMSSYSSVPGEACPNSLPPNDPTWQRRYLDNFRWLP
ncbi:hypothetical protein OC835_001034 [Tilletia horrida]|nr:hypothetical protein OC835_001034 [Tilletia horrida]